MSRRLPLRICAAFTLLLLGLGAGSGSALAATSTTSASGRIKAFAARRFADGADLQRRVDDTPVDTASLDLRLAGRWQRSGTVLEVAWEGLLRHDSLGIGGQGVLAATRDDRWLDLDRDLLRRTDQVLSQRLDRARLGLDLGSWRLSVGRQAASFGGGLVFQPMDLLNPFAPTEIDRDFKRGDDLLRLSRPFDDGSEVELVLAARRGGGRGLSADASSAVARWRGFRGTLSAELMAGAHLGEPLVAVSLSGPLGTAVWRSDWVAQRSDGAWRLSAVANVDWTTVIADRNLHLFAEAYRNGFGLDEVSLTALATRPALRRRLQRGELFAVGEQQFALGATLEWHPLLRQSLLLLAEAQDGSLLLQSTVDWAPDDAHTMQFSLVAPLGGRGEEYGRLLAGRAADGDALTLGGGPRLLLRWNRYF